MKNPKVIWTKYYIFNKVTYKIKEKHISRQDESINRDKKRFNFLYF